MASLHRLSRDGRSWIAAEAALAKAEVAADAWRLLFVMGLAGALMACVFAIIILIPLLLVAVLAPYVGGFATAAAIAMTGLVLLAGLLGWLMWYLLSKDSGVLSVLKRWQGIFSPEQRDRP
jgi:Putative Actinobacterial Holin-X, holin superfamily III